MVLENHAIIIKGLCKTNAIELTLEDERNLEHLHPGLLRYIIVLQDSFFNIYMI
jgi:hypothetical protein